MIKIENVDVYGWEAAIRGARNPMNSWDKMDSEWDGYGVADGYSIGPNDRKLLQNLANAGPDHGKFLRMITVTLDIIAPLYWWKEFDTYKVGTVANSCSTMHKIHDKEFTEEDFSCEHLSDDDYLYGDGEYDYDLAYTYKQFLGNVIQALNVARELFLKTKDKKFWWQLIQLLPTSYNQRRTVLLNYQVLKTMYNARKHHKLDEWRNFCEFIKTLPYSELITDGKGE